MTPRAAVLWLVAYYRREPAVITSNVATLLGPVLAHFGFGEDNPAVLAGIGAALNLAAGLITRALVVPTATPEVLERIKHPQSWQPANPDVNAVKEPVTHGASITTPHDTARRDKSGRFAKRAPKA